MEDGNGLNTFVDPEGARQYGIGDNREQPGLLTGLVSFRHIVRIDAEKVGRVVL